MTPQLDFLSIVVSDMAASVAFYRRLGLAFPAGSEGEAHVEATTPGGIRVALDTEDVIRSFYPGWQATADGGRVGMAFRCAGPAEVDSVFAELVDAGYEGELKPFDAVWGQRYAVIKDPDGNGVDLYAPLS
ncbi:VOC family protein [Nocardia goodfellowii]|uniref:Catechol 2,3-dioxygenase-like lactoylglutathione lyase family enzyme n=1 Tax=Nocardia goodfellowii TaxID=882446 RepID=A0ABS4QD64_9NOCA|nr:VOC family protein [Nocardia goodfellowii]MBP2189630.1 catechol 2,3-dioxygenase-like lactoylglutathione lyase family enzyme [Nocardia goodfellowii]